MRTWTDVHDLAQLDTATLETVAAQYAAFCDALTGQGVATELLDPFGRQLGNVLFWRQAIQAPLLEVIQALETGQAYQPAEPQATLAALRGIAGYLHSALRRQGVLEDTPVASVSAAPDMVANTDVAEYITQLAGLVLQTQRAVDRTLHELMGGRADNIMAAWRDQERRLQEIYSELDLARLYLCPDVAVIPDFSLEPGEYEYIVHFGAHALAFSSSRAVLVYAQRQYDIFEHAHEVALSRVGLARPTPLPFTPAPTDWMPDSTEEGFTVSNTDTWLRLPLRDLDAYLLWLDAQLRNLASIIETVDPDSAYDDAEDDAGLAEDSA